VAVSARIVVDRMTISSWLLEGIRRAEYEPCGARSTIRKR